MNLNSKIGITYWLLITLCCFPILVFSQKDKVNFHYITREEGLSNSTVLSIFQDSKGYIWFGTEDGLNIYDGYKIKVYKTILNKSNSISSNSITYIIEDKDQQIWIGTNYGLNRYDRKKDEFVRYMYDSKSKSALSSNIIQSIFLDGQGNIWIGTKNGLNKYNKATNNFERFIFDTKQNNKGLENNISCISENSQGNLLLGTIGAGIIKFNTKKNEYLSFGKQDQSLSILKNLKIITITKDLDKNTWIGTNGNGVYSLNYKDGSLKNYLYQSGDKSSLSNNVIKSIICDKNDNVWIGTENGGLNIKLAKSNSFIRYENDIKKPASFSSKTAASLLEDTQGNIWIGTHHGGINIYSPNASNFKNFTKGVWEGSLVYSDVKAFMEISDEKIWIGTDGGGINVYDEIEHKFSQYRYSPNNPKSIGSDAVLSFKKDKGGEIWVSTWGGGLNKFNKSSKDFTRYMNDPKNPHSISSNYIYDIHQDKKGIIWIATYYSGINTYNPKTQEFNRIVYAPNKKTRFNGNSVSCLDEDKDGNMWFGTADGGLNHLNKERTIFTQYFNKNDEDLSDEVKTIFTDSKKRLWIGKKGLFLYNYKTKKFNLFSNYSYLVNEQILSIVEDRNGNLWMGTNNGLIQFNPDTKYIKRYGTEDGLLGLEFRQNAAMITRKGEMFFGGFDGFNRFFPDKFKNPKFNYPVYVTDFTIFNKSINTGVNNKTVNEYIDENKALSISYDQSVISFEFAALNYVNPKKTNYAYKLDGFDKKWNYIGKEQKATYTNLDPGDYTFYVKASSSEGLWDTQATSMKLTVIPPFYLTWWFKILLILGISASIFILLYYKRKEELRVIEEENKEKLHQLQLQFFTNISHEFRTPLTLIVGTLEQIFKINENSLVVKHYHTINRNANRLLQLIGELMDFRKAELGALKLKVMPGNFSSFLKEIADDFKAQAVLQDIDFKITQQKEFSKIWYDRQILEKIILNVLNNAFKYTPDKGKIHVQLTSTLKGLNPNFKANVTIESTYSGKEYIYIIITDTGIGISENSLQRLFEPYFRVSDEHVGTGIGLAFVKRLIFLHKGTIQVYSEINKGTQIIIAIPCSENDYLKEELWPYNNNEIGVQIESINLKNDLDYAAIEKPTVKNQKRKNTVKFCILIVDDNDELRTFFREILEHEYYIIEAKDGEEGIKKAKEESPALIISDVMMPVMDGIEFCRFVKDDFETSHIPFILLTAKDAQESRLQGAKSGADYYFSKPVSTEILLQTIKNQLNQQQKIKDRYLKDYQVEVRDLVHSTKDKEFLDRLLKIIENKLEEPELNIDYVSREIGVSKSKLYKKIKDITGQSSNEFIRTIRLKKSIEIMTNEDVSVTEVMYRVGISSHSYFTTAFKKEFGLTPSKFQQQLDRKTKVF